MIELEVSGKDLADFTNRLSMLSSSQIPKVITRATKRTAQMARTDAWKHIKGIYTISQAKVYERTKFTYGDMETVLKVKGPMEGVERYRYRLSRSRGVKAIVKKGGGTFVPRSFEYNGTFFMREGKDRLPFKRILEPSVPQLFGNPEVMDAMEHAVEKSLPERLEHEISRLLR